MAIAEMSTRKSRSLRDPEFMERLQDLRRTDNFSNIYYLVRTWAFLAAVIGGTLWFHYSDLPPRVGPVGSAAVYLLAIIAVGAGQHQLTGLAHEASHHILFKNRLLNDLVSDWFCLFPMFGSTHHYRLQHMAHHQFVNDPERDPDVSQLKTSGHWLRFPLRKAQFLGVLLKQLWIPNLIKYLRVRAQYNSVGANKNPYLKKGVRQSKLPVLVGIAYMATLVVALAAIVWSGNRTLLAIVPVAMWAAAMTFYSVIPARMYHQSRVHPVVSSRAMTLMRISFITALFGSLAWIQIETGIWAAAWYAALWLVPMFTSFSFFMILRQLVQHGNGDRGFLTNTRIFFVHPIIDYCVFPMGQEYHLPHHMFATVPHYRLRELHELMLGYPEYRRQAVVVEGYFFPMHRPPRHPTVLDVLATPPGLREPNAIYIDDSVLESEEVDDREQIMEEARKEQLRARTAGPLAEAAPMPAPQPASS